MNLLHKHSFRSFCILKESKFYELANTYLDNVYNKLDSNEKIPFDNIDYSQGVLNFTLTKNKHFVLNIQRPNRQIWLSSPISGPQRYEYDDTNNKWLNIRNKFNLNKLLSEEINIILLENRLVKERLPDILYMKFNILYKLNIVNDSYWLICFYQS